MQLAKIKVSGFKSFVDPTTLPLSSNLTAIVGPNGCGKSNIIDAVTWVMGESSPKYLRGESLTDVIFNGSTARKPIGQASVELIFDNSDGSLSGQYAKFSEISVKRLLDRDSDSSYYLNGARCRKKDIVDLFLGTGIGPRSYSIIGQNMIAKLIEAKPDELRGYLEEAAGISKYKERRHETELRIRHTQENLVRVHDIHAELEKQVAHLKQQANVAEKYKVLKQQERTLKAEWYGIEWRQHNENMAQQSLSIQQEETKLEAKNSDQLKIEQQTQRLRDEQREAQISYQEVQKKYYAIANEITRLEQEIGHNQTRKTQLEEDIQQLSNDETSLEQLMMDADDTLTEINQTLKTSDPAFSSLKIKINELKNAYLQAEAELKQCQNEWDEFQKYTAEMTQRAQVEKINIEHLQQRVASLEKRDAALKAEQVQFNFQELNDEIEETNRDIQNNEKILSDKNSELKNIYQEISNIQNKQKETTLTLAKSNNEKQQILGQLASLNALQQTALGQNDNQALTWLQKHKLDKNKRLAQQIEVEKGWECAVEKILGLYLQAIFVDEVNPLLPHLKDFKKGHLCIINKNHLSSTESKNKKVNATSLMSKINSDLPLNELLNGIYISESLEDALTLCQDLDTHESIITRDGIWVSRLWVKLLYQEDSSKGILEREKAIKTLTNNLAEAEKKQQELEQEIARCQQLLSQQEKKRDALQRVIHEQQSNVFEYRAKYKSQQEKLSQWKIQTEKYKREQNDCEKQLLDASGNLNQSRQAFQEASLALENQLKKKDALMNRREAERLAVNSILDSINQQKDELHSHEIKVETAKSQKASVEQNKFQLKNQLAQLETRKQTLQQNLVNIPHTDELKKNLSQALQQHGDVESKLNECRSHVEALEETQRHLEGERHAVEQAINLLRNGLERLRLDCQSSKVKADSLLEQLHETTFTLDDILKDLPEHAEAEQWQAKLEQTTNRINRLGPINLVAIDEYTTCLERKEYLDRQIADLQDGLATLQEAISKIDKETKIRFEDTFTHVNQHFQNLFPTIFGGGKAYLELTSDNLLEAGVSVMACPPGKRNSTIHLLSGGEKSLTALALIFSIFQLNPAPFCLLDEVDAALDDSNVLRFTKLVKTMQAKTQFIYISHNKLSIEMAEHLIGVTMNEPGVSRLVSVDIEKAISLTEA